MKTPDPIQTWEALAGAAASLASALIVLFKLDLSQAQQGAMTTAIGLVFTIGLFVYSAWTRASRAANADKIAHAKLLTASAAPAKPAKVKEKSEPGLADVAAQLSSLQRRLGQLEAEHKPVVPPPAMQAVPIHPSASAVMGAPVNPPQNT